MIENAPVFEQRPYVPRPPEIVEAPASPEQGPDLSTLEREHHESSRREVEKLLRSMREPEREVHELTSEQKVGAAVVELQEDYVHSLSEPVSIADQRSAERNVSLALLRLEQMVGGEEAHRILEEARDHDGTTPRIKYPSRFAMFRDEAKTLFKDIFVSE